MAASLLAEVCMQIPLVTSDQGDNISDKVNNSCPGDGFEPTSNVTQ
jgi:hypothetical protein